MKLKHTKQWCHFWAILWIMFDEETTSAFSCCNCAISLSQLLSNSVQLCQNGNMLC